MPAGLQSTEADGKAVKDVPAPQPQADLSPAMQRYLMAIVAAQRGAAVTPTAVARAVGCSVPTSLEMLRRLQKNGLLASHSKGRTSWRLTALGQREVAAIRRRQSVVERFLRTALEMDAATAAEEAALIGPSVSLTLESRLRDATWPSARPCRDDR